MKDTPPVIGIIMGSKNDWGVMQHSSKTLQELNIPHEHRVISAHRTVDGMIEYARTAHERGIKIIIAGAGGAAHLPGMTSAAAVGVPVIGVPIPLKDVSGTPALWAIVQMPKGTPVNTMAVGEAGAVNAAISAAEMLAIADERIFNALLEYHKKLQAASEVSDRELQELDMG